MLIVLSSHKASNPWLQVTLSQVYKSSVFIGFLFVFHFGFVFQFCHVVLFSKAISLKATMLLYATSLTAPLSVPHILRAQKNLSVSLETPKLMDS